MQLIYSTEYHQMLFFSQYKCIAPIYAIPTNTHNSYKMAKSVLIVVMLVIFTYSNFRQVQEDGKCSISTLASPIEVLKIIGDKQLQAVFPNTQTLGIRNVCGEGCSLTHQEFDFIAGPLEWFPEKLTWFLFDPVSGTDARKVPKELQPVLADFIEYLLQNHPVEGDLRVCNKLIPLLTDCETSYHDRFVAAAEKLHKLIEVKATEKYQEELSKVTITTIVAEVEEISKLASVRLANKKLKQTSFTDTPAWCGDDADQFVDKSILVQLLLSDGKFTNWAALNVGAEDTRTPRPVADPQHVITSYVQKVFFVEYILTLFSSKNNFSLFLLVCCLLFLFPSLCSLLSAFIFELNATFTLMFSYSILHMMICLRKDT